MSPRSTLAARALSPLVRAARCLCLAAGLAAPAAAQTFTFDTTPVGTEIPHMLTAGGVNATFSSPSPPGAFRVEPADFGPASALTGRVLLRPLGAGPATLVVVFSRTLNDIALAFVTSGSDPLTLQAFQGSTLVGSVNATGTTGPGLTFFQGMLAFSGAAFNVVRLSAASELAVDNVTVSPAASVVPEPATVALVGTGLGLVGLSGARRKRRAAMA